MARYEVIATSEDGLSGEGPFYFHTNTPEEAVEKYIDFAYTTYGIPPVGPGFSHGGPFVNISVREV